MQNKTLISLVVLILVSFGAYTLLKTPETCEAGVDHEECEEEEQVAPYEIYPSKVVEKIQANEKIVLLDVRTPEEYAENRLAGAILVPLQTLSEATLAEAGLNKDEEIYIYCRSGNRSKQAYDLMSAMGYENIKSVAGGIVHWQEDNYPYLEIGEVVVKAGDLLADEGDLIVGPKISFDKTFYDFGAIKKSAGVVQTDFQISNTGDEILKIGKLSSSCGCTSAKISKTEIAPNEQATLTVYFDPNFHKEPQGQFSRTVFVPTNDKDNLETEVKISVTILDQ